MPRKRFALLGLSLMIGPTVQGFGQSEVAIWTRFEAAFSSAGTYDNPLQQVELQVRFTAPSGKEKTVLGFWDGDGTWRVRFSPDELGEWRYSTTASDPSETGLHAKRGSFSCVAYKGDNPLYGHGAIRLSPDRRYLVHADGTPFFWLADTAWNGALKATEQDWKAFLADRRTKRFTAIQFVTTQWRAAPADREGQVAFTGQESIAVQPAFFQRLDRSFDLCNQEGLVALPVLLWAIRGDMNPGYTLPEDQAILLVRYTVARYGAHRAIWILGGDGDYGGERAKRWHAIGRGGLKFNPGRLATMHPRGMNWPWDEFRDETWLDILTYQSGHGDGPNHLKWNCTGPATTKWREEPARPIINAEPNYEDHNGYHSRKPHPALHVRRAAYWSLLASPPAGLTYGAHGVWSWEEKPAEPLAHRGTGIAKPWREAMKLPGSANMKVMRDLFDRLPWWQLRPADEIVLDRKEDESFRSYIKAAKTADSSWAVVYLPENDGVMIDVKAFEGPLLGLWFDPRTGKYSKTIEIAGDKAASHFPVPGEGDWVLVLHKR